MPKEFSDESIEKIRRVVRQVLAEPRLSPGSTASSSIGLLRMYLGKTDGSGMTARSGTTPGSGTVTLYWVNGSTLETWKDYTGAAITVTAYNLSASAVAASSYVMIMQELLSGKLFAVWEDC